MHGLEIKLNENISICCIHFATSTYLHFPMILFWAAIEIACLGPMRLIIPGL